MVVKVGGSLVSPKDTFTDEKFINELVSAFKSIYSEENNNDLKIVLVVGGGNISRIYRDAARSVENIRDIDQHRIGIVATWMNAELIRTLLDSIGLSYKRTLGIGVFANSLETGMEGIMTDLNEWKNSDKSVLVSGGFINGASTDLNAFMLASKLEIKDIYKLTDIDYIYSEDPDNNSNASPIEDLTWDKYLSMFSSDDHEPGQHLPVDVLAARLAKDNGLQLHFVGGKDPVIISRFIDGDNLGGTFIH